jgi:hypothetical protein
MGRTIDEPALDIRAEVLKRIKDAEARGDKRTARYLAESMVKHDVATADGEERKTNATTTVEKHIADNLAADAEQRRADQQQKIEFRTQELLRVDGSAFDFSIERAREQATREIVRPRYEDDIDSDAAARRFGAMLSGIHRLTIQSWPNCMGCCSTTSTSRLLGQVMNACPTLENKMNLLTALLLQPPTDQRRDWIEAFGLA